GTLRRSTLGAATPLHLVERQPMVDHDQLAIRGERRGILRNCLLFRCDHFSLLQGDHLVMYQSLEYSLAAGTFGDVRAAADRSDAVTERRLRLPHHDALVAT